MAYIGNVGAYDTVDTEQIKDGSVTAAKVAADVATQAELDLKAPLASPSFTGNVGIGVVPSAWSSSFTALQVENASIWSTGSDASFTSNAYYDGSNYKYIASSGASRQYHNTDGSIIWSQASAGTAGNSIAFAERLRIDSSGGITGTSSAGGHVVFNSNATDSDFRVAWNGGTHALYVDGATGNVGIGTSSPSATLTLESATDASIDIVATNGSTQDAFIRLEGAASGTAYIGIDDSEGLLKFNNTSGLSAVNHLVIDSSGNVGINTSSPSASLHIAKDASSSNQFLRLDNTETGHVRNWMVGVASASSGALRLFDITANAERLRIDNSGNVMVGTTTAYGKLSVDASLEVASFRNSSGTGNIRFQNTTGGTIGYIQWSGSSTSYNTSSDYRLKEADVPMTGATERVKALRPINFAWKVDGSRVDGFFAHELAEVVPEAATGTKDAMRDEEYEVTPATGDVFTAGSEAGFTEVSPAIAASPAYYDVDGNVIKAEVIAQSAVHEAYEAIAEVIHSADVEQPETLEEGQQWRETTAQVMGTRSVPDMQGIDQSKLVPLLTATIQELIARIETLEGE